MAKKTDPKLLQETLKRFRLLSEYSFYTEEPKDDDNLILGNMDEADDENNQDLNFGSGQNAAPADPNAAPDPNDAPADDSNTAASATPADPNAAPAPDANAAPAPDANVPDTAMDDMGDDELPEDEEVDVDVTQLVDSTEDAKHAADVAGHKASKLMNKFGELERKIDSMTSITHKIDALEKEIARRNPTPNEKLEMRSLDSAPFNVKLRDYWKDVDGYDTGEQNKPKEYILKKDDIDGSFINGDIKKSFNVPDEDENDYEEEEIY